MIYSFHPAAEDELWEAAHWYDERSSMAGARFVAAVKHAVETIIQDPTRFRSAALGVRVVSIKRFPYQIYFSAEEGDSVVNIWAVMHEKRRPDYWRDRMVS